MIWKEEMSRIRAVQMDNIRVLRVIRRMDKVLNARMLCGMTKGMGESIDEGVLWWFSRVEKMENDKTAKSVYVGDLQVVDH